STRSPAAAEASKASSAGTSKVGPAARAIIRRAYVRDGRAVNDGRRPVRTARRVRLAGPLRGRYNPRVGTVRGRTTGSQCAGPGDDPGDTIAFRHGDPPRGNPVPRPQRSAHHSGQLAGHGADQAS